MQVSTADRTTKTEHTELHMWREIHSQPEVAALNVADEGGRLGQAAEWIAEQDPERLHFAGCGDSRFTGMVGRYAMSRWAGIPSVVHQSFDALAYLLEEMSGGILLAYSNSGESQTTVDCAEAAAARGIPVLAVTGHEGSRLARLADHVLVTILPEAPVAASHTTSHTAMIASTLGLAARVAALRSRDTASIDRAIASAPAAMRDTLEMAGSEARETAMRHRSRDRWVLLGAGPHHPTALTGAAKLYETGYVPAICEQLEEYAHEQMFVLEPGDPVLVVTSRGASHRRAVEIADGVSDLEGDPVIVSEIETSDLGGHRVLPVAPLAEPVEEVAALTHLMPLQFYALHLALARGQDPDRVRYFAVNMRLIGQGKTTQDADL
jgi:glucosamine--fructose-6-phosphate aminotransferase (isomerizing)